MTGGSGSLIARSVTRPALSRATTRGGAGGAGPSMAAGVSVPIAGAGWAAATPRLVVAPTTSQAIIWRIRSVYQPAWAFGQTPPYHPAGSGARLPRPQHTLVHLQDVLTGDDAERLAGVRVGDDREGRRVGLTQPGQSGL